VVIAPAVLDPEVEGLLAATGAAPWTTVRTALALLLVGGALVLTGRRLLRA